MFKRLIATMVRRRQAANTSRARSTPGTPPVTAASAFASPSHSSNSTYDSGYSPSSIDPMPAAIAFSAIDFAAASDSSPAWSGYDSPNSSDFSGGGGDFGGGGSDGGW